MENYMKKKIFVGNLSWKVTEDVLRPVFEAFGEVVSCKIINDQYTGKSKGFGFVEMADASGAEAAIEQLNDKPLMERNMRVSLAQERPERPAGSGPRRDGGGRDSYRSEGSGRSYSPRS
jgi:RNA recognition motif-containing protein